MERYRLLLAALSLLLVILLMVAAHGSHKGPDLAYSLAALRAHLEYDPRLWVGRTVVVHALMEPCPWWGAAARRRHCADRSLVLVGASTDHVAAPLPLDRVHPGPLAMIMRRLPLLGGLFAPPTQLLLFTSAEFRVRVRTLPAGTCGRPSCYGARLLAVLSGVPG